ncbi:MAG TPA: heavy metal-binding domain-containing protein [Caulobacteraceae bacterium]|nr:heavy metal-binding domain-containing protein [Caulobacteraceae bacterium]
MSEGQPFGHRGSPPSQEPTGMIVTTTENVPGHRTVQALGQVFGVVVRSRGLGGNIAASLRSLVGGEIKEYTALLEQARQHALDRMIENATLMGANAVVMMRFDSTEMAEYMTEIVAYGTAAVIEKA